GFLAAYVLVWFSATPNPMLALWRPLLAGIGVAVALQLVLSVALRDRDRAALVASATVLVLSAAWVPLAVAATAATWLLIIGWRRRRHGEPDLGISAAMLSRNLAVFALAFAAVSAIPVLSWGVTSWQAAHPDARGQAVAGTPDIVVLLVDGYPRSDALLEMFGINNAPFEAALAGRGFGVAAHSRSNYTSTWTTLASMFHGKYVEEIPRLQPAPTDPAEQYRRVMLALEDSPVLDGLRRLGYEVVTVPSPFESAVLTGADRILSPPQLSSFELSLLQHSLLGRVAFSVAPGIVFDQHRGRLESTLALLTDEVARPSAVPRFVFAHLLAPHAPVVYNADGSAADPVSCFPACSIYGFASAADWGGFPGQLEHVNQMVLDAVDAIIAGDPDAIVIVMSDHGSHRTGTDAANAFRNFFAARVPGNPTLFEDDVTPLTVLARLAGIEFRSGDPYRGWASADLQPLTLTPWTGPLP
ncbi:MAG TPA: hypothetical protein VJA85_09350, partial [Candidatus Limnocylindria bacterium]|nr:hypothetical protein [Candidatus Limnocylindria bacterium]